MTAKKAAATKEVVKKEENTDAALAGQFGGMMDDQDVSGNDVLLAAILLCQPTSDLVLEEKARIGNLVGSLEGNILGDVDNPVEIIPFKFFKTWTEFKLVDDGKGGKKQEFHNIVPVTLANAELPREEMVADLHIHRFETINYYCALATEVAKGDFMPYVVSFRSTSYRAGKQLETIRGKLKGYNIPLCFRTFKLGAKKTENDKGKFCIFTIEESRKTTEEELAAIKPWFDTVEKAQVRVDTSHMEKPEGEAKPAPGKVEENADY